LDSFADSFQAYLGSFPSNNSEALDSSSAYSKKYLVESLILYLVITNIIAAATFIDHLLAYNLPTYLLFIINLHILNSIHFFLLLFITLIIILYFLLKAIISLFRFYLFYLYFIFIVLVSFSFIYFSYHFANLTTVISINYSSEVCIRSFNSFSQIPSYY